MCLIRMLVIKKAVVCYCRNLLRTVFEESQINIHDRTNSTTFLQYCPSVYYCNNIRSADICTAISVTLFKSVTKEVLRI